MMSTNSQDTKPAMRKKRNASTPDGSSYSLPQLPSLLTRPLGLEGWTQYEPVLLAALTTTDPLLLIGPHGSAKSFLLERLAKVLDLDYRFYNASLINYDDLVGMPMPDETRTHLRYLSTPTAIWDAEIVFIDELNRTRPELQNKLFPIIHERRVQGIDLKSLRFRWAAMNPPPSADSDMESLDAYLGAEPLDPALADRFPFLIFVPGWEELTADEQRNILMDQFAGEHPFAIQPTQLIANSTEHYNKLTAEPIQGIIDYSIMIVSLLKKQGILCSARRACMLHSNIIAIQAARMALYEQAFPDIPSAVIDWNTSALIALQNSLPQVAQGKKIDPVTLLAAHRQTWGVIRIDADNPWRVLLQIEDPLDRFIAALHLGDAITDDEISNLLLDALGSLKLAEHRKAAALAFYLTLHEGRKLRAIVFETLAQEVRPILQPHSGTSCPCEANHRARLRKAVVYAKNLHADKTSPYNPYSANLISSLIEDEALNTITPKQLNEYFLDLIDQLISSVVAA